MKHHINLYGAEFRPKRLWASLNQMALVWGGCLLLLADGPGLGRLPAAAGRGHLFLWLCPNYVLHGAS